MIIERSETSRIIEWQIALDRYFDTSISLFLICISLLSIFPNLVSSAVATFREANSCVFSFEMLLLKIYKESFMRQKLLIGDIEVNIS